MNMRNILSLTSYLKIKDEMGYSFSREAFNTLNSNVKTIVMDQLFENLKLHFAIPQKHTMNGFNNFKITNLNLI